jgi:hypothetical protein
MCLDSVIDEQKSIRGTELLDKEAVMGHGVLAWQCKVNLYTRFLEDLALMMEARNGSIDLIQCILVELQSPDKITKFHKCCDGSDNLGRDMTSNRWQINLVYDIRTCPIERKKEDRPSSRPSSRYQSTV